MILAAGEGRRLLPLTAELPKALVPVLHRPAAWFAIDVLHRAQVRDVVVNTFHLGATVEQGLKPWIPNGMRIRFLHEPELLGTGGGLRNASSSLLDGEDPVIVMNSDIVFDPDVSHALAVHERSRAIATMIVRRDPRAQAFGAVEVDATGRVRRLLGRPPAIDAALETFMFTGVHILSRSAFDGLPERGCIVRQGYLEWLLRGEVISGCVDESPWHDLGTLESYHRAHLALIDRDMTWPGLSVTDDALVDRKANVGDAAHVVQSVVGRNARIANRCVVQRSIVWPDAVVDRDIENAIITPLTTVQVNPSPRNG